METKFVCFDFYRLIAEHVNEEGEEKEDGNK